MLPFLVILIAVVLAVLIAGALRAWSDGEEMADPMAGNVYPLIISAASPGAKITAPRAGIARNMFIRVAQAPGVGGTLTLTLYKNGIVTALTASVVGIALVGSNVVNSVAVAKGDDLLIALVDQTGLDPQRTRVEVEFG